MWAVGVNDSGFEALPIVANVQAIALADYLDFFFFFVK
jgi:hypothetical protein